MREEASVDRGNAIAWGKTSADYSTWRPNYPRRFFDLLASFGVGLPGQRILDLGTGVGFLAERFGEAGADVTGVDIDPGQIDEARRRSTALPSVEFIVAAAEDTGLPSESFDVVTASQAWLYFDKARTIPEVRRLLRRDGLLVTCHFSWLPRLDPIARASEALVLRHNANWTGADWSGDVRLIPEWAEDAFRLHATFVFDEAIPFTRESWRGRMRACRGIGATLSREQTEAFDCEHDALLTATVPERFSVLHRIDAVLLRMIP
jgi:SAM-dependent methyltransferase